MRHDKLIINDDSHPKFFLSYITPIWSSFFIKFSLLKKILTFALRIGSICLVLSGLVYRFSIIPNKLLGLLKYGFCNKLLLYEWNSGQLDTFFIKIRFCCHQNIKDTLFFTLSECVSNVLMTGESNFGEKSVQLPRVSFIKK